MTNQWSFEEEKRFQAALLCYREGYPNRWENIAQVVGFSREMVFQGYQNQQIVLGLVQPSQYLYSSANNQPPKWQVMLKSFIFARKKEKQESTQEQAYMIYITLANSNPGHLNHLLSSRPHLVPHSRSMMQQYHQAALPIHHDIQLNQLSTHMDQEVPHVSSCVQLQNPHYQPNSQVVDQSLPWNHGDQSENPHYYQPNPQVVDQSLPWNQGDQFENSLCQPNSQVVDQSLPGNQGDQFESESLYEEVMNLFTSLSPSTQEN
ncbi:hypothetical protein K1719_039411 [Acacia pycnantha]|nr:hypothetical protein K1719_039411 [Acacia pycnantha]